MKYLLIGEKETKRTYFLQKAAKKAGITLELLEWETLEEKIKQGYCKGAVIKIDPLSYQTIHLQKAKTILDKYLMYLKMLQKESAIFLNSPKVIADLLDKKRCKKVLQESGIAVTKMIPQHISNIEELCYVMQQQNLYSVFIKPCCFSGAAGIVAFRMHPKSKKMTAYTSCYFENGQLCNSKKLRMLQETKEMTALVNAVLHFDCIVEQWVPKADYQGASFDLRVVYQFQKISYIVVRAAKGPITNLHLNNHAIPFSELALSDKTVEEINELCHQTAALFPGLQMAGMDIMLGKHNLKPRIIEMNGQGDLIYQDIYQENKIYTEQIRWMSNII